MEGEGASLRFSSVVCSSGSSQFAVSLSYHFSIFLPFSFLSFNKHDFCRPFVVGPPGLMWSLLSPPPLLPQSAYTTGLSSRALFARRRRLDIIRFNHLSIFPLPGEWLSLICFLARKRPRGIPSRGFFWNSSWSRLTRPLVEPCPSIPFWTEPEYHWLTNGSSGCSWRMVCTVHAGRDAGRDTTRRLVATAVNGGPWSSPS